jgi:hypothetical protein
MVGEASIMPPHMHTHLLETVASGSAEAKVEIAGGTHGAMTLGMHGIGVSAPIAAAVAAMTCGFAMLWHIPKGGMFTMGKN